MGAPEYVDLELEASEEGTKDAPPQMPREAPAKIFDVASPSPARSPDDKHDKHDKHHDDHGPRGPDWKGDVCQCCGASHTSPTFERGSATGERR